MSKLPQSMVLIALLLAAGCARKNAAAAGTASAVPVAVAAAVQSDETMSLRAVGSVEGSNVVSVRALVGGVLQRTGIVEGQDVHRGDILFVIDPRPYVAVLRQAQATLARDRAHAASTASEAERYSNLVQKDYVTKQEYDDARAEAAAAVATVQADSAAVETARLNLEDCTIRASIAGRAGTLPFKTGDLVKANDDTPLVVLQQITPVLVDFTLPERWLPDIRRYDAAARLRVRVTIPSDTSKVVAGSLSFIDNAVDAKTGTILLKATFANEDAALWPGMFVDARLDLRTLHGALVVPTAAVQPGQQGSYVWVVKPDGTVEMRPITAGPTLDDKVVIETGLQPAEQVVTDGQLRLVPGARVSIRTDARKEVPST